MISGFAFFEWEFCSLECAFFLWIFECSGSVLLVFWSPQLVCS